MGRSSSLHQHQKTLPHCRFKLCPVFKKVPHGHTEALQQASHPFLMRDRLQAVQEEKAVAPLPSAPVFHPCAHHSTRLVCLKQRNPKKLFLFWHFMKCLKLRPSQPWHQTVYSGDQGLGPQRRGRPLCLVGTTFSSRSSTRAHDFSIGSDGRQLRGKRHFPELNSTTVSTWMLAAFRCRR